MSEWKVLQRDRLPAYITWERYLANQQRLPAEPLVARRPRRAARRPGAADGPAGLRGLWAADVRRLPEQGTALL